MNGVAGLGSVQQSALMQQIQQTLRGGGMPEPPAEMQAQFRSAAEAAGLDPSQLAGLRGDIESAVQSALQGFDGSGSPREAIEGAITGVLEDNGIDAGAFKEQLKSAMGGAAPGAFGGFALGGDQSSGDLLGELLDDLGGDAESSDALSIAEFLRGLPSGSLINRSA